MMVFAKNRKRVNLQRMRGVEEARTSGFIEVAPPDIKKLRNAFRPLSTLDSGPEEAEEDCLFSAYETDKLWFLHARLTIAKGSLDDLFLHLALFIWREEQEMGMKKIPFSSQQHLLRIIP